MKCDLNEDLSSRVAQAQELARTVFERLLSSSRDLDQVASSSLEDLRAYAALEEKLKLGLLKGKSLVSPRSVRSIAQRMPRVMDR